MNPSRGTAAFLTAVTAVTSFLVVGPADAKTGAVSADSVDYAWIKSCPKKDYTVPCGKWKLVMRSGKTVTLTDAQSFPRRPGGKVDKDLGAPFRVSGDGRIVSYLKNDRLVVRDVSSGEVRPLPGRAATLPRGADEAEVSTALSADGSVVVVDYGDANDRLPSLIADLRTGKVVTLPAKEDVAGFSPDGEHLLTTRQTADNTTEFSVFGKDGRRTARRVVPQIVANNAPFALADDGTTVAVVVGGDSGRPRLHTYDLTSDAVSGAVRFGLPKGEEVQLLGWGPAGALTMWNHVGDGDEEPALVVKRTVNAETGATRKLGSFKPRRDSWIWWAAGE
ncbi:hypothetical protein [Streptosporangium sandarakinum]|uniref:hypothetical protein n=1 Tax=Streptosporangium sandarakinum TaxID=1260955 RepID=UPI0034303323